VKGKCFGCLFDELRFSGVYKMASIIKTDAVDPGVDEQDQVEEIALVHQNHSTVGIDHVACKQK
jgi:hypothetical protein